MQTSDLRKAGLKATLPRLKILEVLQQNKQDHLSAEDVYRKLLDNEEDIGLATIYRVLSQFEDAGLVIRHHFEDGHALFDGRRAGNFCLPPGFIHRITQIAPRRRQPGMGARILVMYNGHFAQRQGNPARLFFLRHIIEPVKKSLSDAHCGRCKPHGVDGNGGETIKRSRIAGYHDCSGPCQCHKISNRSQGCQHRATT